MRIATSQIFQNNIDNLSRTNSDLYKTQQQISTGKRVLQPSDDPLASAQILKLTKEVARTDQFKSNIDVSNRRLGLEENTLNQLFNSSVRLKELTIQAGNGTLAAEDRASIASEVDQILNQMQGLMNTKDVQGEYLFSGFKGHTQAYTYDEATQQYVYQGDSGQRFIQVGPDNHIASTDSGTQLFEQVDGVTVPVVDNSDGLIAGSQTDATKPAVYVTNFDTFQQGEMPYTVDIDATGTLTVSDGSGNTVLQQDGVVAGDKISFNGLEFVIGNVTSGSTYSATIDSGNERKNILNVALDLRNGLKDINASTDEGKSALNELLAKTLSALDGVQETNLRARGSVGARMNALDQQQSVNDDYKLFTQDALSSVQDLDYNEAISRFTLQQTVLQAAYSSFNQIRGLSLFNYIQ